MTLKKSLLPVLVSTAFASAFVGSAAHSQEVSGDISSFKPVASGNTASFTKYASKESTYIVQLKDKAGVSYAIEIGEMLPQNSVMIKHGNKYLPSSTRVKNYTKRLKAKQADIAAEVGASDVLYNYTHSFNGFAARLTGEQATALSNSPDVVAVWKDDMQQLTTAHTPSFLGLTAPGGQHSLGVLGEDVIVGVVDSGIWPENPSFADDGSYSDPTTIGWSGTCDPGLDPMGFSCNNKMIGATYFKEGFEATYDIQYALGEFESPRDADGHGSHTSSTAAGNVVEDATVSNLTAGTVSGMAPRARIAMYKACWNSLYVSPSGAQERGCFYSDTMAAIDQAVQDGVDVINYSIGGSLTDLTTPPAVSMLLASDANVFVSVSAGNSGPDASTVGTPAPWVTNVGASTYDGYVVTAGQAVSIDTGSLAGTLIESLPAAFGPSIPEEGLTGEIALAEDIEACSPLTNPEEINGKIALISRGACNFVNKVAFAEEAGAIGVIVYTYPDVNLFNMSGDGDFTIPSVLISYDDGMALTASLSEELTTITMTSDVLGVELAQQGNSMASFSSRGPNASTGDLIKPDITAPGVNILAATSAQPMFDPAGEDYAYLSGTSMAAPHIAGLAALFKEQYPEWSPAQIKSALMTTSYQGVTKEDGLIPADPFDFGAGHVSPVPAMDPGLTYDAGSIEYLGYMCGLGEEALVTQLVGVDCATLTSFGYSDDPSQLNYPSIAVSEIVDSKTVSRTVTDVSGLTSHYFATIEAPEGFSVSVQAFDATGAPTEALTVEPMGSASYELTFTAQESAAIGEWSFGSITWEDEHGHSVRSPIALKAVSASKIEVPESLSLELRRGRASFPVLMNYSGRASIDYTGLVPAMGMGGSVVQDPNQSFGWAGPGTAAHIIDIPEGTKVARFSLRDSLVSVENADLDLYLYECHVGSCTLIAMSGNGGSNEDIILTNPTPAANYDAGEVYILWVHGYDVQGAAQADYVLPFWIADSRESTTRISMSSRAISGRYNSVRVTTKGLDANSLYMGAVTFYNDEGIEEGTTVLEVQP